MRQDRSTDISGVPFFEMRDNYFSMQEEIEHAMLDVCVSSEFILGSRVKEFEENFSRYLGVKHSIGVANGTDALTIAFRSLELDAGSEILVPANTFIATAIAVHKAGHIPVPVDVNREDLLIDLKDAENRISKNTRAIAVVHLYGQMPDMGKILNFASSHGLRVIEDAAQAHGASFRRQRAGSWGDIGCFSFYPSKNLGAFGDGGMITTNIDRDADFCREYRNYGSNKKNVHPNIGVNSRLDTLQAAILDIKLTRLEAWNRSRYKAALLYDEALSSVNQIVRPSIPKCDSQNLSHVFHLYVIRCNSRDSVIRELSEHNIGYGIHYPTPYYLQGAFSYLRYYDGTCPAAESLSSQILSLPMFPEISVDQIDFVANVIKGATD